MEYIGSELELFENAKNWKSYWTDSIAKYIKGDVLEVGAGLGGSTSILTQKVKYESWNCLEPDGRLASQIDDKIKIGKIPSNISTIVGFLKDIPQEKKFDIILYIDVLEHIEKDKEELSQAAKYLKPDGLIIVLAPAHNYLFSPFDKAIGHYRRYNKAMVAKCTPESLQLVSSKYYDCVGLCTSLANKLILKQSSPTLKQIAFWDTVIIPISKVFDKLSGHFFGKTIIGLWQKAH